jgi:two-component system, chemotaxis family, protein-glutamate methylesterase/glutaminase
LSGHNIIVVGASAGGVEALSVLARELPAGLPAAVFVVLHIPAHSPSMLPSILSRAGQLPALQPTDGMAISHGCIYVARPDHHMLLERGYIRIVRGPRENHHRPAIDPLFRSAARSYGPRVAGVILTGMLDDGTAGLLAIKQRGGVAIVQDPKEALYPSMPSSALEHVPVDHCLTLSEISTLLVELAHASLPEQGATHVPEEMEQEIRVTTMDLAAMTSDDHPGTPSAFSCPECGGVLWELNDGNLLRFRCRTGHAYSPESMLAGQSDTLEEALWVALKTLEESLSLSRRLGRQARERGQLLVAERFEERAADAEQRIVVLRQGLLRDMPLTTNLSLPSASTAGNGAIGSRDVLDA